jgi:hypothetical protein
VQTTLPRGEEEEEEERCEGAEVEVALPQAADGGLSPWAEENKCIRIEWHR